jgi:hypothetical protein
MREDNITKIFDLIKKVGCFKLNKEDITDSSVKIEKLEKYFNGKTIKDYYADIYSEFKNLVTVQLDSNCDVELLEKFADSAKQILNNEISGYKFIFNSNKLERLELTTEEKKKYYLFSKIHQQQKINVNQMIKLLEYDINFFKYRNNNLITRNSMFNDKRETENTFKISNSSNNIYQNKIETNTDTINKATLNLSKADSIMFIHMLEVCELIKFESNTHKINFIEQHFNYTELRNNSDYLNALPIKDIQVEFSNLKSRDKESRKRFNKNLETLKKKFEKLMDYDLDN